MAEKKEQLFAQFKPVTTEEWRAKVEVDLKGADFNKKLVWRTNEGFDFQPMYRGENIKDFKTTDSLPGEYPYLRGTHVNNDWSIRQDIDVTDVTAANEKAKKLLTKGVTALGFKIKPDTDLAALLDGIDLGKVEVNIMTCCKHVVEVAEKLVELVEKVGATDTFSGSVNFDPFKHILKKGTKYPGDVKAVASALLKVVAPIKGLRCFTVDAQMLNNAGAFVYQELGYALSWGNEFLAELTDAGFSVDEVAQRIKFNMGVCTVYFMELAKFRAARMLWAQIVKQYGPKDDASCKMLVNAITTEFNQTVYDPYVNLLRSQTEAMSAALANVDEITVTPFDHAYKAADDFSERMARNQQILLKEESHLDKVVDPAGGSYYIESLTMSIAKCGWQLFVETEDLGGFNAALEEGVVVSAVNKSAATRHDKLARRREQLVGVNQFPNFTEKVGDKADNVNYAAAPEGALNNQRLSSEYEQVRLATERATHKPKAFMLTIGNKAAMRIARAQFSCNFFACAGYDLVDNLGFATVAEGVEAAIKANADIVVLCSSDEEYPTYIPDAIKELDGRAVFVLAGPETDEFKAMGVENFINVRTNVLETLKAFNAKLLK